MKTKLLCLLLAVFLLVGCGPTDNQVAIQQAQAAIEASRAAQESARAAQIASAGLAAQSVLLWLVVFLMVALTALTVYVVVIQPRLQWKQREEASQLRLERAAHKPQLGTPSVDELYKLILLQSLTGGRYVPRNHDNDLSDL